MTLEEYKIQRALGTLSQVDIRLIASSKDTPTEILLAIRDEPPLLWPTHLNVILNLDKRGIE